MRTYRVSGVMESRGTKENRQREHERHEENLECEKGNEESRERNDGSSEKGEGNTSWTGNNHRSQSEVSRYDCKSSAQDTQNTHTLTEQINQVIDFRSSEVCDGNKVERVRFDF